MNDSYWVIGLLNLTIEFVMNVGLSYKQMRNGRRLMRSLFSVVRNETQVDVEEMEVVDFDVAASRASLELGAIRS